MEIMYQQPYVFYSPRFVVYFLIHLNSFIEKVTLCVERMHYALCMHGRLGRVIVGMGRAGHQKLQSVNALELMSIKVALIANCFQFDKYPPPGHRCHTNTLLCLFFPYLIFYYRKSAIQHRIANAYE